MPFFDSKVEKMVLAGKAVGLDDKKIAAVKYREDTKDLFVLMKSGAKYIYAKVPKRVYFALLGTFPHVDFFDKKIKVKYTKKSSKEEVGRAMKNPILQDKLESPIELDSSNLDEVRYYPDDEMLYVQFKSNAVYRYHKVPRKVFIALLKADSHGSFFYYNIRTSFKYERQNPFQHRRFLGSIKNPYKS